jgi:bifunctional non-homologous end joining protein LigD
VAPVLLPHIAGRPLTLKRYPEGVEGQAFFQKHVTAHRPDWIQTATVNSASSRARGTMVTYLVVDDLPALIWAANLAGLELHVPMWRMPDVRRPDLLVFDLDPGEPADIVDCCRVAQALRPLLEAEGFAPLAKTSGGKGLQLYAPISGVTSDEASEQALMFAERLERDQPGRVVSRMTKVLRKGKVLIDWSQNNGSKTTVAPYSLRARSQPTVSTPVSWQEVESCRHRADLFFTADAVLDRISRHADLFAPLLAPAPLAPRPRPRHPSPTRPPRECIRLSRWPPVHVRACSVGHRPISQGRRYRLPNPAIRTVVAGKARAARGLPRMSVAGNEDRRLSEDTWPPAFPLVVSGYLRARDAGQDRERCRDDGQGHDDAADGQQVVRGARRDHRAVLRLRRVHRGGAEARPDRHNRHRQQRDRALQRDDPA